jgi:NADH-quinone oxidoreductase subunit N
MAATVKAAAFATFLRVWLQAFPQMADSWYKAIFWVAIVTMVAGNAIGLVQKNLKRLLAYSSIAHAGYLLVLVSVRTLESSAALVFYLLAYSLATFGAFAAVISLSEPGKGTVMVEDLAGLWKRRPWTALGLGVMMLSLLGFPFFGGAGFFAKWYLLQTALHANVKQTTLAVMIVLTSVLSAGYYLRVVMVMFMRPTTESTPTPPPAGSMARGVLFATVVATLLIGVAPEIVVRWTEQGRIIIPSMRSTAAAPTMPPARPGLAR